MKNIKIIVLIISMGCLGSIAVAQDTLIDNNRMKNSLGIVFSSKYSVPFSDDFDGISFSNGIFTYKIGLSSLLVLGKKKSFFVLTNVGYLNNGWIFKDIPNTVDVIDNQGNINFDNVTFFDMTTKNNYVFVSIEIGKNIWKLPKGYNLFTSMGFQGQYLYLNKTTTDGYLVNEQKDELEFKKKGTDITQNYNIALTGSIGILKNISQKTSLIISPYFIYDLNATKIKGVMSEQEHQFYSIGLKFNILYHF